MSDSKPSQQPPSYKVVNARGPTDPDAEYRDGTLYIIVFPDETKHIVVTDEEIQEKKAVAKLSTERTIGALQLQKAGEIKFAQLFKTNQLPTPPKPEDQPQEHPESSSTTTAASSQKPLVDQTTEDLVKYYKDHLEVKEDGQCDIFISQRELDRISLSAADEEQAIKLYPARPSSQALRAFKQSAALAE